MVKIKKAKNLQNYIDKKKVLNKLFFYKNITVSIFF